MHSTNPHQGRVVVIGSVGVMPHVALHYEPSCSLVFHRVHLIPDHTQDVKTGEDRFRQIDLEFELPLIKNDVDDDDNSRGKGFVKVKKKLITKYEILVG